MKRNPVSESGSRSGPGVAVSSSGGVLLRRDGPASPVGPRAVECAGAVAIGRGRFMTRARCWSMSRPRSRWAGTVWPIWPWSARSPACSGRSPRIRRCHDWSPPWPPTSTPRCRRSARLGRGPGPRCGRGAGRWPARPVSRDGGQVIVDLDATLVTAHSDKEHAEPTYKRGFGFAPMCAFVDHGEHGTGETLVVDLRPGKASPFDTADHISRPGRPRWPSCPTPSGARCWSAPTPAASPRRSCTTSPTPGWSTRSGSPPTRRSRPRSRRSPSRPGGAARRQRRRAPRRRPGRRAHRLDAGPDPADPSPARPSTGRRACGSSPAANAPTPARSCG